MDSDPMDIDYMKHYHQSFSVPTPPADIDDLFDEQFNVEGQTSATVQDDGIIGLEQLAGNLQNNNGESADASDYETAAEEEEEDGRLTAMPDNIPDFTQGKMHQIAEIRQLYDAYHQGYKDRDADPNSHLERAKNLAYTLLKHYYPENQGFSVQSESFDIMAKYGWSIPMTKDFADIRIPREQIAGFVVYKNYTILLGDDPEGYKDFPHTYLAILATSSAMYNYWQGDRAPGTNRADIMSYSLGVHAKITHGYGTLIVGNHLEFWAYDNNKASPMEKLFKQNWSIDMSREAPSLVAQTFEAVAGRQILYQNGVLGEGPKKNI